MEESKRMVSPSKPFLQGYDLQAGISEASNDMVSIQGQHPILRDFSKGGHQRRASFPDYRQECTCTGSRDRAVSQRRYWYELR